jgi:LuxR family maltose regulon positive regulatory protein
MVNELSTLGGPLVLVLDDFHEVSERGVLTDVDFLLLHGPRALRVVVVARGRPPLRLHTLRLAGELVEIGTSELGFTAGEAGLLLAGHGLSLRAALIAELTARTAGWAAGLRLAALGLTRVKDPDQFVMRFAGDDRYVLDYLVTEVLDREPPDRRRFMLRASVARHLTGSLAEVVTGVADGNAMLSEIESRNLFLVARPTRPVSYRWHPMFAAALRSQLEQEAPGDVPKLHARAAAWYATRGFALHALEHAVAAGDWKLATEAAAEHWLEFYVRGRVKTLPGLLAAFPSDLVAANPELSIAMAAALLDAGDPVTAQQLIDAAAARASRVPGSRRWAFQAALMAIRLQLGRMLGRASGARLAATTLLATADDVPGVPSRHRALRALLLQGLGMALMMEPEAEDAISHLQVALEAADAGHLLHIRATCLPQLALMRYRKGELDAAASLAADAIDLARRRGQSGHHSLAGAHLALGATHHLRDELDQARDHLEQGASITPRVDRPVGWAIAIFRARLLRATGDVASARSMLVGAQRVMDESEAPRWLARIATVEEATQMAAEGDVEEALTLLSSQGPSGVEAMDHMSQVVLASIQVGMGRFAEARAAVLPWLELPRPRGAPRISTWVLHAVASAALDDQPRAEASFNRAIVLAAPDRIRRPFVEAAELVRPLLRGFVERRTPYTEFALDLLERVSDTSRRGRPRSAALAGPLSGRELTVLRHLQSPLTLGEIARQLYVSVNTIKSQARSIYRKLGVDDRHQAARRAQELGLV